jgi:hypothetical protein
VARFVIDFLLNRQAHHAGFQCLPSDYSSPECRHQRREVPFSLLEERDDASRDENVLRATADAINVPRRPGRHCSESWSRRATVGPG